MDNFTTLNGIIEDLLNIIRGSQLVRTEPISNVQVEAWIHQYRNMLIKRDLEKGKLINPDYIQVITDIAMSSTGDVFETDIDMPNTVFRLNEPGYTWIGDTDGTEYQYMTEQRSHWQSNRRYTSVDPYVYLKSKKLVNNVGVDMEVHGIFENPMEVIRLNGSGDMDSVYPIPADMIPTLKEMILKGELNVESSSPNDDENDRVHDIN